jgi:hypothetical protein
LPDGRFEELARARVEDGLPDALLRTFGILERLHAAVPSPRVVMCGHRMLAGAGGWLEPAELLAHRAAYLRLFELRGFDEDETERFLRDYRRDGRAVPPVCTAPSASPGDIRFAATKPGGTAEVGRSLYPGGLASRGGPLRANLGNVLGVDR